jgi:hypothetical protein
MSTTVRTAFRPDADGFAFPNSFALDLTERTAMSGLTFLVAPAVASVVPVVGPVLAPLVGPAAAAYVEFGPLPSYGLCGGMCYTALDYWLGRVPLPRGGDAADEPVRSGQGAGVRNLIWSRLMDSLIFGGVLTTTIEWMLRLNVLPGLLGGGRWLRQQTWNESARLKSHLDQGQPWPIGLVGTTLSAWNQHQVLAYGYEDTATGFDLLVYDPNDPKAVGDPFPDTKLSVDFSSDAAVTISGPSLSPATGTVVGFFCSGYSASPPDPTLTPAFGRFVTANGETDLVVWGARFPVADATELATLGGTGMARPAASFFTAMGVPRDGAILQDRTETTPFLLQGGARFALNDTNIDQFGGAAAKQSVPRDGLKRWGTIPDDGTLLREIADPRVFLVQRSQKRWVTTASELARWGGFASVRLVPDGALAVLPDGPPLPNPDPNECAALATAIAHLEEECDRLQDLVDSFVDSDNPRDGLAAKLQLARAKAQLQEKRQRRTVLGCV